MSSETASVGGCSSKLMCKLGYCVYLYCMYVRTGEYFQVSMNSVSDVPMPQAIWFSILWRSLANMAWLLGNAAFNRAAAVALLASALIRATRV
jgi:hypothetical protein